MSKVSIRYFVSDVDAAIDFYTEQLDFKQVMRPAPPFAMLERGDLRLLLNTPGGGPGGGAAMPDGTLPQPGGWNRFQLEVEDLDAAVIKLQLAGVRFRNKIVTGMGGRQILLEDPSGNPVELFQAVAPEAGPGSAKPAGAATPQPR
jgi:catechol 2,3-dioxygenase-like lactoylglutathione lyase family enzyme